MTEEANTKKNDIANVNRNPKNEDTRGNFPVRLTLDKRIDLAINVVIILYGIFLIVEARDIPEGMLPDPITSKGMPYLTGVFLIIGGIILGALRLASWSALPGNLVLGEGHEDEEGLPSSWTRVFGIVIVTFLAMALMPYLGYLIAIPIFMIMAVWLMGARTWALVVWFPLIYTIVTWYIFSQPLQFVIPLGFLAPIFRAHGLTP